MRKTAILATFAAALGLVAPVASTLMSAPAPASSWPQRSLPSSCDPADPETCLYTSDLHYEVDLVDEVSLVDRDRDDHEIPLLIRYPELDTPEPRPVIIWNHGGLPSRRGATRSAEWGELLASAGYVVIHPARLAANDASAYRADCEFAGVTDPDLCEAWVGEYLYGSANARYLIAHLDDVEALDPALAGLLDADRIAVAGHSAGSTVPLALAGAWQQWDAAGTRYDSRDDAPIAFLATGVHGPTYAGFGAGFQSADSDSGFDEHSFAGIDRPFMSISGLGDETKEPPEARTSAWLTSQGNGHTYLSWDTDGHAVHETMDIDLCDTAVRADHCRWIGSAGLAFLDAHVRGRPDARLWINSDAYRVLTGGVIDLHRR